MVLSDIKDVKKRNWERQIARNGKLNIYFKNNFNLLVMNETQLKFLYWQNVHQGWIQLFRLSLWSFLFSFEAAIWRFSEKFCDIFYRHLWRRTLQTLGLELEMLKLMLVTSFTGIFLRFCLYFKFFLILHWLNGSFR